jgi:glycosyltransferase involved in cell wall biosynthesis
MNILLSLDNYDHGTGGAEMAARALAHQLTARGHAVQVLQRADDIRRYDDGLIRVHTRPLPSAWLFRDADRDTLRWNRIWGPLLADFLRENPADLILTQNRLLYSTVDVAVERRIPVAVFAHAFSMFCPTQFRSRDALRECDRRCPECLPWRMRLKYGRVQENLASYERGLRRATLLCANSRYMQEVIRRFYGIDSAVVYPTADLDRYRADGGSRDSVLFVKPQYVKGLPILLAVAERAPDLHFLVAGDAGRHARRRLARLPNVECLGWVQDMRPIYARTRVLVGPSIWPEPFGRVFVEAAASGIPSVASARGGIPEAVGDGGILIDDIFDADRWVAALRQLQDPTVYATMSNRARHHALRFAAGATVAQFLQSVQRVLGIEL